MSKKRVAIILLLILSIISIYYILTTGINFTTSPNTADKNVKQNYNDSRNNLNNLTNFKLEAKKSVLDDINGTIPGIHYCLSFTIESSYATETFLNSIGVELFFKNETQTTIGKSSSGINYSKRLINSKDGVSTYLVEFYEYSNSFNDSSITRLISNRQEDISAKITLKNDNISRLIELLY